MEENSIRFEDIPNAITGVLKKLSSLEDKIDGIYELVQSEKEETWFTVAELCAYLPTHPVEHTIYGFKEPRANRRTRFKEKQRNMYYLHKERIDS